MAIKRALPGFALLPGPHKLNAGSLQGLFDIHVSLVHQAPGLCLEVSHWPDHCLLGRIADRLGGLKCEAVGLLESVGMADWPMGQGNVVPVPVPRDLQDNRASGAKQAAGFVQADVLVVYAEVCAGVDVVLRPWNVCFPVVAGLFLGEHLGLVEVGGVAATKGPENKAVTRVGAQNGPLTAVRSRWATVPATRPCMPGS